jgi:XTP/dITP diphosphohydrolase
MMRGFEPGPGVLVATTNPGKLREIEAILHGVSVQLVTLNDLPPVDEPEETGTTFAENARLKALYYAAATGLPSVADDSGLEIEALGNEPGVHSARWHGTDYAVKFEKIHEMLRERGLSTSPARFVCRVALARGGEILFESEGS